MDALSRQSVTENARMLLGWQIVRHINGQELVGTIVETEAYHQADAASHSYNGKTARTAAMFGQAGHAYIYFTYGMHYCFNVVTGPRGVGSGVLIRAVEPVAGQSLMAQFRGQSKDSRNLTNGPAKLCQAFNIDKTYYGHDLSKEPLFLRPASRQLSKEEIVATTRVGITKDTHRLWRFYIKDNPHVSKP